MRRRDFMTSLAAAGTVATVGRWAHTAAKGWRKFEITYRIDIKDSPAAVRLWIPVPQDALDYQRVVDLSPISIHCMSGWRAQRGCLPATSSASGLRTRT